MGAGKNGRARGRHARLPLVREFSLRPLLPSACYVGYCNFFLKEHRRQPLSRVPGVLIVVPPGFSSLSSIQFFFTPLSILSCSPLTFSLEQTDSLPILPLVYPWGKSEVNICSVACSTRGSDSGVDCKTARIFSYSSTREQSNKSSGTRLKTESGVRLARFTRVRLLRHALMISLLILRKKTRLFCSLIVGKAWRGGRRNRGKGKPGNFLRFRGFFRSALYFALLPSI